MKKLLTFLLGLQVCIAFGQSDVPVNEQINVNAALNAYQVSNPDMSSFQKVNHIPMNSYTGRAEVNIPLFEIQSGDITVPISISYNTSGVKVADVPSSVGSNWSLNVGGSISKTIKGVEDFYYKAEKFTADGANTFTNYTVKSLGWFFLSEYKANPSLNDLLDATTPFTLPNGTGGIFTDGWENTVTENDDNRPDLFRASAPGLNTSFVHRKDKTTIEINNQGNTIISEFGESDSLNLFGFFDDWEGHRKIKCIRKIDITNPQGITYTFGNLDISQSADVIPSKRYGRQSQEDLYSYNQVDSYHLSRIKSVATTKEVSFIYDTYQLSNDEGRLVDFYQLWGNNLDNVPLANPTITNEQYFINKYPQLNRLNKIHFDKGSVEFIHSKSREDYLGEQALEFIKIKDFHGNTIKTYKFEYGYFIADTGCNEPKCKRLKLLKIRVLGKNGSEIPGYNFTYNETKLPERTAFNHDYSGYANAPTSTLIGGAPQLFFAANKGALSLFPVSLGNEYQKLPGVYSMAANLGYTKAGVLTKIKYPTGASTEFAYELNSFLLNDKEVKGVGLRLKAQRIIDETGEQQILDYNYTDFDGRTSGRMNAIPLFGKAKLGPYGDFNGDLSKVTFDIYASSQSMAELTDGAYVGYSRVLIKNRENHGITENIYSSSKDHPDMVAPLFEISDQGNGIGSDITSYQVDFANQNGGFQDLPIDNGLFRGKMKLQRMYTSEGKLVFKKEINYKNDKYSVLPLIHVRNEWDLIAHNGQTRTRKYMQKIDLESQRHMPTSEKNTTFFANETRAVTITNSQYHPLFPLLKEQSATNSLDQTIKNKFYYPDQKSEFTGLEPNEAQAIDKLITNKQYSTPVQIESYIDATKTYTKRTDFNDWSNGIVAPSVQKAAKGSSLLENRIEYHGYDTVGNPTSLSQTDGTEISYIYGYKKSVVIAELKNISFSSIPTATITSLENLSNLDINASTEEQLRSALDQLRTTFSKGQITTYTYDPLIGVTSVTDPKGISTFYEYDSHNRLKTIRDLDQNILKEYCYGYREGSNPCGAEIPDAPEGVYIQVGNPKTYNIPIPNKVNITEYSWDGIEIDNPYNYKSLHPVFFAPRPRYIHEQNNNSAPLPNLNEYNLPYPEDFYSSGWKAERTGTPFELVGLNIDTSIASRDTVEWGIIINDTKLPLLGKIPELSNVIFLPKCLQGVTGIIFCEITKLDAQNNEQKFIVKSAPITFQSGLINNDKQGGLIVQNGTQVCEFIDVITIPDSDSDTTTDPDIAWEDTDWTINLEQDPDVDSDTTGGSGTTGPIQVKIAPHKQYRIPIPNNLSVAEYSWWETTQNTRKSLHPVFYYARPQIPDDPTTGNVGPMNTNGLTLPYPVSYYSSGWYVDRGGYEFRIEGLETLTEPHHIEWLFKVGNQEYAFGAIAPEAPNVFFVPSELQNKTGRVICRIYKGSLQEPSEIIDIKSPIMIFKKGLNEGDNQNPAPQGAH